jgi:hypothetical protein
VITLEVPLKEKRTIAALLAAVATFAVVVILFLPTSCSSYDGPAGAPAPDDACPRGATLAGVVWPNMYVGLGVVPLVGLGAGAAAAHLVRRRDHQPGP